MSRLAGFIHMNGRVYSPKLGRMLSPDPLTQAPENGQNYDRYTYALNNPLKYTDPSGHQVDELINGQGTGGEDPAGGYNIFVGVDYPNAGSCGHQSQGGPCNDLDGYSEYIFIRDSLGTANGCTGGLSLGAVCPQAGDQVAASEEVSATPEAGIMPTQSEYDLVAQGRLAEMWQARCAAGDPIGCVGFATWGDPSAVVAMHGNFWGAYWVNIGKLTRLNATAGLLEGNPHLVLSQNALELSMLQLGQAIAVAHLDATSDDTTGVPAFLSAREITEYHHDVFEDFNVSPRFYGGTYISGEHGELLEIFYCIPACDTN